VADPVSSSSSSSSSLWWLSKALLTDLSNKLYCVVEFSLTDELVRVYTVEQNRTDDRERRYRCDIGWQFILYVGTENLSTDWLRLRRTDCSYGMAGPRAGKLVWKPYILKGLFKNLNSQNFRFLRVFCVNEYKSYLISYFNSDFWLLL